MIESCLLAAGTAPSGANLQPWHFPVIESASVKKRIRAAAEEEERAFYNGRAPQERLEALAPLGTDADKPFLEEAPILIAIFAQKSGTRPDGQTVKYYYVPESVGLRASSSSRCTRRGSRRSRTRRARWASSTRSAAARRGRSRLSCSLWDIRSRVGLSRCMAG